MMKKLFAGIVFLIPLLFCFFSAFILVFTKDHTYEAIQHWFKKTWPTTYDPDVFFQHNFTLFQYQFLYRNFYLLLGSLSGLILLLLFLRKALWKCSFSLVEQVFTAATFCYKSFIRLTNRQKIILALFFSALTAYRLYFFLEYTMQTDETASFLFSVRQGFLQTSFSYVSTNNHIFYNEVVAVLYSLFPFFSPKLIIRLPALVADFVLWYALFCVFNRFYHFPKAIFMVAGTCFCFILSYYATQGRGYKFQELFVLISVGTFLLSAYYHFPFQRVSALFVFTMVAGIYTNPLFIYHSVAMFLWGAYAAFVLKQLSNRVFLQTVFSIAFFTFLVYLPVLLVNGFHGFIENRNMPTQTWQNLLHQVPYLIGVFNYNLNIGRVGFYLLAFGAALFFFLVFTRRLMSPGYKGIATYFLLLLVSISLVSLFKGTFPPERGFSYFVLLVNLTFLSLVYDFFIKKPGSIVFIMGFLLLKILFCVRPLYWAKYAIENKRDVQIPLEIYRDLDELSRRRVKNWQFTVSNDYYPMYLRLYLVERQQPETFFTDKEKLRGEVVFIPTSKLSSFDLKGYRLWKSGLISYNNGPSNSQSIYVLAGSK